MIKKVWPDVAVEEGNLTKGVFTLRQLLEEDADARYIDTIPKRGYRFVATVTTDVAATPPLAQPGKPEAPPKANS